MPFNRFGQWEPLSKEHYISNHTTNSCSAHDMNNLQHCSVNLHRFNRHYCQECGLIFCSSHSRWRHKGYRLCESCNLHLYQPTQQNKLFRTHDNLILSYGFYETSIINISNNLPQKTRNELAELNHRLLKGQDHIRLYTCSIANHSKFISIFTADNWIIKDIQRDPLSSYHTNDVIREQFLLAAIAGNFITKRPREIILFSVRNEQTIYNLSNLRSYSNLFIKNFVELTPLGKFTSYLLKDLNLEIITAGWENNDIRIVVKSSQYNRSSSILGCFYRT